MDYGGIRIFKFLQKNLFPKLKPWKMDVTDYKMALQLGARTPASICSNLSRLSASSEILAPNCKAIL